MTLIHGESVARPLFRTSCIQRVQQITSPQNMERLSRTNMIFASNFCFAILFALGYSLDWQSGGALLLPRCIHVVHAEVLQQRPHVDVVKEGLEAGHVCEKRKSDIKMHKQRFLNKLSNNFITFTMFNTIKILSQDSAMCTYETSYLHSSNTNAVHKNRKNRRTR
jgi:putative alpha-1,2-mannosidase